MTYTIIYIHHHIITYTLARGCSHPRYNVYIYVYCIGSIYTYIYLCMYYTYILYIYISSRQHPFHLSNCYDHGYRFFWGHIAFQCFVPLSLLERALSLYSVSCTPLTKVLLQYYSGLQQFWSRLHNIYIHTNIQYIYIYEHTLLVVNFFTQHHNILELSQRIVADVVHGSSQPGKGVSQQHIPEA